MNCVSGRGGNPHLGHVPKRADIIVTAERKGGEIEYSIDTRGNGANGRIKLEADSGPYRIHFELEDKTGRNLRFDAAQPFFCASGTGHCPTCIETDQIMVDSCDADELVVVDWNFGEKQELRYQINVTDRHGAPQPPVDPVIENGGGIKPLVK